ncbi:hypothetical protein AB0D46_31175 [Streptomyces sp. NPDC048383]|uniref:hypothetical protein n=1 Tax=Streptomyces sp. NPDC048383 TaxID=3155386 RepID=UPI003428D272
MDEEAKFDVSAPWSWSARYVADRGCPRTGGVEFLLYSDAHVTGDSEVTCYPYAVTNCLGFPETGRLAPVLALHLDDHFPDFDVQPMNKTDTTGWLNLTLDDEIACLISLVAGIRLRTGGRVRTFRAEGEHRGAPEFYAHRVPDWTPGARTIYPVPKGFDLAGLKGWLDRYLALGREDAVALVRAARHFRDALWVADTDPELAWLLLVSAIEVVAGRQTLKDTPAAELLRQEMPELAAKLVGAGGEDHLEAVAPYLVNIVKATARFKACVERYRPGPPSIRPEPYAQVEWDWPKLKKAIDRLYGYRSERLHAGVPFPHPLCQEPMRSGSALDERPSGTAAAVGNAAWVAKDLPMHLHTFGHIVQGCLLNWWQASSQAPLDHAQQLAQ